MIRGSEMRKLAWITVGFTYFLMVWGNLVSSTGSGLACPDWPTCHGTIFPTLRFDVILEWGHRLLAFSASLLIVATIAGVFRSSAPQGSPLKRSGRSLLVLLGVQILLGGTTVLLGLSITVSTIHLIVATLVFSGLITVATVSTWGDPRVKQVSPKVRRLAVTGLMALLIQFFLGGLVRHSHSGLACPFFPSCLNGFFPIPFTFETAVAFAHRWWGILLLGTFVHLVIETRTASPGLRKAAITALLISITQVLLGVFTVLSSLGTVQRAVHAAVGYGLWGLLFYITLRSGGVRWLWQKA